MKALQHSLQHVGTYRMAKQNVAGRFFQWCAAQEKNRLGWLAAIIAAHGCILTPLTLVAIIFSGNNIIFWFMATAAMAASLVTNLAALPTRITIPVFFISVAIDLFIALNCVAAGFNIAAINI
jgi:hypothetical protein